MSPQSKTIPQEFKTHVIDALENIYDIPHLQSHPLHDYLHSLSYQLEQNQTGNPLRKQILSYLETLSPHQSAHIHSPQHRLHNVLYLRYVEGLTVQQTAIELGISTRQAYRDLQKGKDDIIQLFWDDIQKHLPAHQPPKQAPPSVTTALNPDMSNISLSIQQIDLAQLLQHSLSKVKTLVEKRTIQIHYHPPTTPIKINTDAAIAQQIIISTISKSLQQIENQPLQISLLTDSPHNTIQISFKYPPDETFTIDPTTNTLAKKLGWSIESQKKHHHQEIHIQITSQPGIILVIDDNEGIIDLFKRYLAIYDFKVIGCTDSTEGLQRARTLKPAVIFLDVMMPYIDGWEILQNLQIDKETQHIPVVICSVFYDPGLAFSLGAAGVISKPVRKDDITAIFHDLGIA